MVSLLFLDLSLVLIPRGNILQSIVNMTGMVKKLQSSKGLTKERVGPQTRTIFCFMFIHYALLTGSRRFQWIIV